MLCKLTYAFALASVTLRTPLYTSILFEVYIFSIIDTFVYEQMLCKLTYVVALRVLTLRTFLYTCISLQVYMYHTIDTLVYEPKLCELTHVSGMSNAHTLNLFVYMKKFANIHVSYDRYFCIRTQILRIYICIFCCQCTLWSSLYTSTYLQIHICHSIDTRVRIWAHAVQTRICFCPCECSHLEPLCIHQSYLKCTYFLS